MERIPQKRIIEKNDEYMSRRDYKGAERHLLYWLEEARLADDRQGELMVRNELVGHYRKTGNKEGAFESAAEALGLLRLLGLEDSESAGTTYVNTATAYNAFGENELSLAIFKKAREIYEGSENTGHQLLGGLYNNMALTCVALDRFDEAEELYDLALRQMERVKNGELEQAITLLNMANAVEKKVGLERGEKRISELLETSRALLDTESIPRNGYYAFVCEKCAPTFLYYGYFADHDELMAQAKEIYERP